MSEPFPISRTIDVGSIPAGGTERRIVANETERAALAETFGLLGVESFIADLTISPWRGGGVAVDGRVQAHIVQRCVVSLVPVDQDINEPIAARFVPSGSPLAHVAGERGDIVVQVSEEEPPDVFQGHSIDIGAVAVEYFALAIDPYPRAPGAVITSAFAEKEGGKPSATESPFAVLAKLKKRGGGKA